MKCRLGAEASFTLDGIAEGDCVVEVTLDGTSLKRTVTYPVQPAA